MHEHSVAVTVQSSTVPVLEIQRALLPLGATGSSLFLQKIGGRWKERWGYQFKARALLLHWLDTFLTVVCSRTQQSSWIPMSRVFLLD